MLAYDGLRFEIGLPEVALATDRPVAKRVATLGEINCGIEQELNDQRVTIERASSADALIRMLIWTRDVSAAGGAGDCVLRLDPAHSTRDEGRSRHCLSGRWATLRQSLDFAIATPEVRRVGA
jgi:hypothetical protein